MSTNRIKFASYLSQDLQKYKLLCLGIPSVISTWDRRQPTHMLDGFGVVKTPHWQHRLKIQGKENA